MNVIYQNKNAQWSVQILAATSRSAHVLIKLKDPKNIIYGEKGILQLKTTREEINIDTSLVWIDQNRGTTIQCIFAFDDNPAVLKILTAIIQGNRTPEKSQTFGQLAARARSRSEFRREIPKPERALFPDINEELQLQSQKTTRHRESTQGKVIALKARSKSSSRSKS